MYEKCGVLRVMLLMFPHIVYQEREEADLRKATAGHNVNPSTTAIAK